MKKIIYLLLLVPAFIHAQDNNLRYGITDYSVRIGYPVNLIIRCETGIDSIQLHMDTSIFKIHCDYYSKTGIINPEVEAQKVICHRYSLDPLKTGSFKLKDIDLWSEGELYTVTIKDSILVREEVPSSESTKPFDFGFHTDNMERYKDKINQKKSNFKLWFDQEYYSSEDTISLYFLANRTNVEILEEINFDGLIDLNTIHTSSNMLIENGKKTELFLRIYKFIPSVKGKISIDTFKAKIDGHLRSHKSISCKVE